MTHMTHATTTSSRRRRRLAISAGAVMLAWLSVSVAGQYAAQFQRGPQEFLVTFEFDQVAPTTDQITILFTNDEVLKVPNPVFGTDIVQEFSFSGRDFPGASIGFDRRIRDKSFLNCRYIRVVNHGTNRWNATTISLVVDGQRLLNKISMYPRKGSNPKGGIEGWNRDGNAVFWEAELQQYRPRSAG